MKVTLSRVVRSEMTKVRSLRSTWIVLAAAVLVTVGMAAAFGYGYGLQVRAGEVAGTPADAVDATFIGLDLLSLIVGVFGILQLSGEYGSGLIRASLTAVPRRWPLVTAKALVLLAVLVPLSVLVCVASFLACQALAGSSGASLGAPGVLRAVIGAAAYPVATALIGLGIGALLRHTAGSIAVFVGGFLIVPALLPAALPDRLQDDTLRFLPIAAGQAIYTMGDQTGPVHLLSPAAGGAVLAAWVLAILSSGAVVLYRRDA
jgi:ABC-2 type transport system permease protein